MHSLRTDFQRGGDLRPCPASLSCSANLVFLANLCHLSEAQHPEQSKLRVLIGCETDQSNFAFGSHGDSGQHRDS